jgi:hypothetical protein
MCSGRTSARASSSSMITESLTLLALRIPTTWRAQPQRYLCKAHNLLFHLSTGDHPVIGPSHTLLTISLNPSLCIQQSSNLNCFLHEGLRVPVVKRMGAWSHSPTIRSRARIDTNGYLSSHSVSINVMSSFSYVKKTISSSELSSNHWDLS